MTAIVNTETGEITEPGTDLAHVDQMPAEQQALAVVTMLDRARHWLADAVENTGPAEIAAAKAEIVTAETYSRQLGLSKEIQQDAQEMVRRAEYALGKAIRKGQAEGTVFAPGTNPFRGNQHRSAGEVAQSDSSSVAVTEIASRSDLYNSKGNIMDLAAASPEQFEEALAEAKAEGSQSRANVVRKVKAVANPTSKSRAEKADLLEDLAKQGFSSRQMGKALGFSRDDMVRELAREYGIEIPADKSIGRTRRINSTDVVANTVSALEGLVMGVELIDYDALDLTEVGHWADSLTHSLRTLNKFSSQIRKAAQ